jgi:hypothetical protein
MLDYSIESCASLLEALPNTTVVAHLAGWLTRYVTL